MTKDNKHIIIVGFKSVGKSTVARALSNLINMNLVDLDVMIEQEYADQKNIKLACREIVEQDGENYFRELESLALAKVLKQGSSIIALGGGALTSEKNRALMNNDVIVHITADKAKVFERIVAGGRPAYYDPNVPIESTFNEMWAARNKLYKQIATITSDNSGDAQQTAQDIANKLSSGVINNKNILLLHGPNLNMLGMRDELHYGKITLTDLESYVCEVAKQHDYGICCYQSNYEGKLIDLLQQQTRFHCGVIINPGALSHYSYALHDALLDTKLPIVEVHLSNLSERETWRQQSVTAAACIGQIDGKNKQGYCEALELLVGHLKNERK